MPAFRNTAFSGGAFAVDGSDVVVDTDPLCTDGLITLYELDLTRLGGPKYFFSSAGDIDTDIFWGGQIYTPLPMEATGFEYTTRGAIPQPTVTMSNLFGAGNLLLDSYKGLIGADLIRILTLRRFLDDGETPDAAAYITRDVFVVAQKTSHNAVAIAFKLASRIDQQGTQLPRRQIMRDVCSHIYRYWDPALGYVNYSKATCPYTGGAAFNVSDQPTTWENDVCSRRRTGCQARFIDVLPGRFFPGVGLTK
jgi:lambda family phage minor tail protein L